MPWWKLLESARERARAVLSEHRAVFDSNEGSAVVTAAALVEALVRGAYPGGRAPGNRMRRDGHLRFEQSELE
jgi:hypothetical protein